MIPMFTIKLPKRTPNFNVEIYVCVVRDIIPPVSGRVNSIGSCSIVSRRRMKVFIMALTCADSIKLCADSVIPHRSTKPYLELTTSCVIYLRLRLRDVDELLRGSGLQSLSLE
jgi:hypothetical protein